MKGYKHILALTEPHLRRNQPPWHQSVTVVYSPGDSGWQQGSKYQPLGNHRVSAQDQNACICCGRSGRLRESRVT